MSRDLATLLRAKFPRRTIPARFSKERYAHDAGMQWEEPAAVATPGSESETRALVRWCAKHDLPITARGAGSSIAGNAFGAGLVIDFSRRMNRIVSRTATTVTVEPGVVLGRLNRALARTGRRIGPSPSSEAFCTVGGMIGNNAAGSHSLLYGATAENLLGARFLLSSGERLEWRGPRRGRAGRIQERLSEIANTFRSPWPDVAKNSSGYLLDRLGRPSAWHPQRVLCGSEGTLGLVTRATLATHPRPPIVRTALIRFETSDDALGAVPLILRSKPAAIELVDEAAVKVLRKHHPALPGNVLGSGCSLVVDMFDDDPVRSANRSARLERHARESDGFDAYFDARSARDRASLWTARRDVEPLLRSLPGRRRPLPFVEDVVVPVLRQVDYVRRLRSILARAGLSAPLYGHAGQGNLHVRPFLDVTRASERTKMQRVNLAVARLARTCGGSLTGEHGDGYLRSALLRRFYPDAYRAYSAVKELFDPTSLLNPGKVVETRRATRPTLFVEGPRYSAPPWL